MLSSLLNFSNADNDTCIQRIGYYLDYHRLVHEKIILMAFYSYEVENETDVLQLIMVNVMVYPQREIQNFKLLYFMVDEWVQEVAHRLIQ